MRAFDDTVMAARLGVVALLIHVLACGAGGKSQAPGLEQVPAEAAGQQAGHPESGEDDIVPEDLVRVHLLADTTHIAPGQSLVVAARFDIAPGWYVYWENPGEAGLSTDLALAVPEGFEAGPVRYPGPVRFESPGPVTSYGYAGQVLLSAQVRAPDVLAEASYEFSAQASWLACKAACVRGRAPLALALPAATGAPPPAPANQALFAAHEASLPQPWQALPGARHAWVDEAGPVLVLSVPGADRLWFFPAADNQLALAGQEMVGPGGGQEASLRLVYKAGAPLPRAYGVLGVARAGGTGFYVIDVPRSGSNAR